jgi:hypothetical protein
LVKAFLRMSRLGLQLLCLISLTSPFAYAQFAEQGPKLPAGNGAQDLGTSVSLSADGNTAIVGSPHSYPVNTGMARIYTRTLGTWSQQAQLVGSGWVANTTVQEGFAVAISADGTTAIIGGPGDGGEVGAAWPFARNGNIWTQQSKLVQGLGFPTQGASVALSADGNTAIVGAPSNGTHGNNFGGAWIYIRSGGIWSVQGSELVVNGMGALKLGTSVALSADGNTAIIGSPGYEYDTGSAFVFTRSNGVWSQSGLISSTDAVRGTLLGNSVSVSADGKTAVLGGPGDNSNIGAAWIFKLSGSQWAQQGSKLIGSGASGAAKQGTAVSMSSDGTTIIVGGPGDKTNIGAAWFFAANGNTYAPLGPKLVGSGGAGSQQQQGTSVSISGDGLTAFVGAPLDGGNGAAWIYAWPSPPPIVLSDYKIASPATVTCPGASKIISGGGFFIMPLPVPGNYPKAGAAMCTWNVVQCPVGAQTCSVVPNANNCYAPGVSIAMVQAVCQAPATR